MCEMSKEVKVMETNKQTNNNKNDNDKSTKVDSMTLDPQTNTLSSNGQTPTVASVVRALQRLGASPQSIVSILETMKRSGAIAADIEVL